ncbi:hypothetical protein [Halomarina ordinaria]|uniref:DUF2207 domain-containing protein n=1 Tax=Halomarina ordinaria TaxID=3033939 RepID=A0ABD5U5L1_9EURY|nr:hypothetical protein [Halomarina sp. PSRA2]
MSEEPDWAIVLAALHEAQRAADNSVAFPSSIKKRRRMSGDLVDTLQKSTDLTSHEVRGALDYLRRTGLVDMSPIFNRGGVQGDEAEFISGGLTEKGFAVIHERQMREQRHKIVEEQKDANKVLTKLTFVLVVATSIQALSALFSVHQSIDSTNIAFSLVIGTAVTLVLVVLFYILLFALSER